ncbi:Transmembrane protein [Trema orientale]|uniref:Transmembrane protein n=1 Tax=Trema orientale TaxID=63057 RepID=A0A2P5EE97_TREOI|nr:Transmembrane protein [Trema orientale]
MSKAVSPKSECSEESGWTAYFQDFSNNNSYNNNNNNHDDDDDHEESLISCTSSLVSDAASYAAWKMISLQRDHHHVATAGPSIPGGGSPPPKKLSFKKTRTKEICSDESLEDTASSPANSPKIGDLKRPVDMKTKYMDDHLIENNSLGKRGGTSEYYSEVQDEERSIVDFNEKNDCIDLKKRGLCLVPLSMLVNYLG